MLLVTAVVLALVTGLATCTSTATSTATSNVVDVEGASSVDRPEKKQVEGPKEPLNILVMGSDNRDGAGNNIDNLTGGGKRPTPRSCCTSRRTGSARTASASRGTRSSTGPSASTRTSTPIPGGADVMWNEAFSVGGPACTIAAVEQLTGIRIDHFVVVDFAGFRDMVDAIGGVQVCVPEDIEDPAHGINIPAGTRKLRGDQALDYVRARYVGGQRRRHRPDEAPAGVHRRDGAQGRLAPAPWPGPTGWSSSSTPPPSR